MAVYTAESGQTPARVTLMRIPEKVELRQKNMYSVSGGCCRWWWRGGGCLFGVGGRGFGEEEGREVSTWF
jgi:uncharacterized protein with WD repeat